MLFVTDEYALIPADPRVLEPGVTLRRDWHVQLIFAPKAGKPEKLWVSVESVDGEACTGRMEESGLAAGLPAAGDQLAFDNRHVADVRVIHQPAQLGQRIAQTHTSLRGACPA